LSFQTNRDDDRTFLACAVGMIDHVSIAS
jgi:hypothetical protein